MKNAPPVNSDKNEKNDHAGIPDRLTEETIEEVEILKKRIGFVHPATTSISLGEPSATVVEYRSKVT